MKFCGFVWRFAAAAALLAVVFAGTPPAQAQTVMVNGSQLTMNPGPIERAGRVFVPLRSIFEQMGASVVYQSGTINATRGQRTISLTIGSTQATVDGQTQIVDVAPFIVGATTYVPLRFIAQSLGATVNYNSSTNVVAITHTGGGGAAPPPYPPPRPYPPAGMVQLRAQQPSPGSRVYNRFALISAEFTAEVAPGSIRVWLDGADRTRQCGISRTNFSYKPPAPLSYGSHTVRVSGRAVGGAPFDRSWSFSVAGSGGMSLTIAEPAADQAVGMSFTVAGSTAAYAKVNVTAGPAGSPMGLYAGSTVAGSRGNFRLTVSLRAMPGLQAITLKVTATEPNTSQISQQTLQLRVRQ